MYVCGVISSQTMTARSFRQRAQFWSRGATVLVGFLEPTPEDDNQGLLFLHVEREERHTVESLYARNQDLYRFAAEFGLESYDGMDVGPIENRGH